jgi:hypothetical protein
VNTNINPFAYVPPEPEIIDTPFGKLEAYFDGPSRFEQYGHTIETSASVKLNVQRDMPFIVNGRSYNDTVFREGLVVRLHANGTVTVEFDSYSTFTDAARRKLREHFGDGAVITDAHIIRATYRTASSRAASAWREVHDLTEKLADAKILLVAANGEYVRAGQALEKLEAEL